MKRKPKKITRGDIFEVGDRRFVVLDIAENRYKTGEEGKKFLIRNWVIYTDTKLNIDNMMLPQFSSMFYSNLSNYLGRSASMADYLDEKICEA